MRKKLLAACVLMSICLIGLGIPLMRSQAADASWTGEYFTNPNLAGSPALTRQDSVLTFDWGDGAPAEGIPADNFSVRWTRVDRFWDGVFAFAARADDGVRMYVDGVLVIDKWQNGQYQWISVDRPMTAGDHRIVVEYRELTGRAALQAGYYPRGPLPTTGPPTSTPLPTSTPTPTFTPTPTATLPYVAGTPGPLQPTAQLFFFPPPLTSGITVEESLNKFFSWEGFPGPALRSGGHAGQYRYAKNHSNRPSLEARWHIIPDQPGYYSIYVYIPPSTRATQSAAYRVYHGGELSAPIEVDQAAHADQWVLLGHFYFAAWEVQYLSLSNATSEPAGSREVLFDAVVFIYKP